MPHLPIASTWAGDTLSFTSGSRPSCRRCVRFRYSRPAAWPAADGLNLTASQTLSGGSWGWGAKELHCSLGYQLHSLTAARTCAIDDHPANEIGPLQSDFLHDQAADRETKYVDLLQVHRLDEGDGVGGHLFECGRDFAGAAGDARVVEQDHLAAASQAIGHRRVPVIHGAEVVLIENERHAASLAEPAIGEADPVSFDELRRSGLVTVLGH